MADHGVEKVVINGRLNTRSQWTALGREQNRVNTNYEQQDDGSVRVRAPWVFPRRPNLLTANQASLETDTTGWAAAVNCSIIRSVAQALHGTASLRLSSTGAGDMSATTPTGTSGRAVVAGRQYTALAAFRADASSRVVKLYIRWYNAGGAFISEDSSTSADAVGSWSQVAVVGKVAPVGATFAAIAVEIIAAGGAAELHYVDQISLAYGSIAAWNLPAAGTPNGGTNVFWSGLEAGNLHGVYVSRRDEGGNQTTIHRADDETTPDWGTAPIDTIAGGNYMVPFVVGNGIVLYGNFTFPSGRLRFWNGSAAADASAVAVAGRALAYHKERFWSAAPAADPDRVYYSAVGDHTSWDLNNYIPVGPDDGGIVEDIAPALGGLLIAKSNGIWFLTGDGPNTFVLTKLDGGEGHWGRCICSTPYGAAIAGTQDVYLWQGGSVEPISVEHPDYGPGPSWVTTAFRDDKLFITTNGTMWVRDMAAEKWRNDSGATGADAWSAICNGGGDLDILLSVASSSCDPALAGLMTCNVLSANRVKDEANRGQVWQISTGFFPLGPLGRPFTVDRVTVLVRQLQNAGAGAPFLFFAAYRPNFLEGASSVGVLSLSPETNAGLYRYQFECSRLPMHLFALNWVQAMSAQSLDEVLWEVLDAEVEYHVEEPR